MKGRPRPPTTPALMIIAFFFLRFAEDEVKRLTLEEHECVCEGSACASGNRCRGYQCFSSLAVTAGALHYQKGCFNIYEQSTMTCKTPASRDQKVECCHGHLCNLNITVQLPVQGIASTSLFTGLSNSFVVSLFPLKNKLHWKGTKNSDGFCLNRFSFSPVE